MDEGRNQHSSSPECTQELYLTHMEEVFGNKLASLVV